MKNVAQEREKSIVGAIKVDEKETKEHLNGIVRQTVEETLNSLLNAETDAICNAGRYQRGSDRLDTLAGAYPRKLLLRLEKWRFKSRNKAHSSGFIRKLPGRRRMQPTMTYS